MVVSKSRGLALTAALLLAGCSAASDALFPSLEASNPAAEARTDGGAEAGPPALGNTNFEPPSVTTGRTTGTFVGRKVVTYREELRGLQGTIRQRNGALQGLRNQVARNSVGYHENVATISSRLQLGTTPGNPVLNDKWTQAQIQLNQVSDELIRMNQLANDVASDSAMAAYLLDSVRAAFNLQGAIEEDHRQLRILEDETNQTVVLIERLLSELSSDITRQQQYVANEKSNLNTLAVSIQNGQLYGASLSNRMRQLSPQGAMAPGYAPGMPVPGAASLPSAGAPAPGQRPLVVIRFDRPNVAYEQALYQAVNRALERRPNATFDLVAVAPTSGGPAQVALGTNAARRNAEQVLRSLNNMGLPPDRVRLSAMNSPNALTSEVHIYVR